ncbi:ABC transporter permease [Iodidimonas gelatinilytica]|uniref:ABC transporter permease n=1 Tax=Iodidimonas gelatinilytica TaxID=1236966 RepID=UPI001B2FE469|nr:ABC transporter permease [Iodidimonas gelatinilytica]
MIAYISQMIRRHRTTPRASLLNLLGLGFALTVLLVLIGEIRFQTSFDQWIPDSERILKLETTYTNPSGEQTKLSLAPPIAAMMALPDDFPELEAVTAIWPQKLQFIINDEPVEKMAAIAHQSVFSVFDLPFLHGSPDIAFSNPDSIVISAKEASSFLAKHPF